MFRSQVTFQNKFSGVCLALSRCKWYQQDKVNANRRRYKQIFQLRGIVFQTLPRSATVNIRLAVALQLQEQNLYRVYCVFTVRYIANLPIHVPAYFSFISHVPSRYFVEICSCNDHIYAREVQLYSTAGFMLTVVEEYRQNYASVFLSVCLYKLQTTNLQRFYRVD
jgi:hypothetical protein